MVASALVVRCETCGHATLARPGRDSRCRLCGGPARAVDAGVTLDFRCTCARCLATPC